MSDLWLPKPHLSASQINSLDFCARSYYYQTVEGISTMGAAAFAGSAAHHALEFTYKFHKRYGRYPDPKQSAMVFARRFNRNSDGVSNWEGYDPQDMLKMGMSFILKHVSVFSQYLEPVNVENRFEVNINGIKLVGYIDLETEDTVWDHKFRYKTLPSGKYNAAKDLQLTLYAYATGKRSVGYMVHYLKEHPGPTTKPAIEQRTAYRTDKQLRELEDIVSTTVDRLNTFKEDGDFPRVHQRRCSGKSGWVCPFYQKCWGSGSLEESRRIRTALTQPESLDKQSEYERVESECLSDPYISKLPWL